MRRAALAAVAVGALVAPAVPAAAEQSTVRVMALGDSITAGVGDPTRSGYRITLQGLLRNAGVRVDMVGGRVDGRCCDRDHEGHPGWTAAQVRDQVQGWARTYAPDVVLLHIGTNDISRNTPARTIALRVTAIVRAIRRARPLTHVFVARIIGTRIAELNRRTAAFNALLPGVVAAAGARVYLVDMADVGGALLADSRHPTRAGYEVMAARWYEGLRANIVGAHRWPPA